MIRSTRLTRGGLLLASYLSSTYLIVPLAAHAQDVSPPEVAAEPNTEADEAVPSTGSEGDSAAPREASVEPEPVESDSAATDAENSDVAAAEEGAQEGSGGAEEKADFLAPNPAEEARLRKRHTEDRGNFISWPFSSDSAETGRAHRWAGVGAFIGWVRRPSGSDSIVYHSGLAYGGYLRPEITSWLGLRLYFREERIPVTLEEGALDFEGETFDFDFTQPDLEVISLGGRLEPTWVIHPRLRLHGIVGWSWLRMRASAPKAEGFEISKTYRAAVQTDITIGLGLSFDIIRDWLDLGIDVSHSFPNSRTGDAYQDQQVIVDGQIRHIAPLPRLGQATDVLFSLGLIL